MAELLEIGIGRLLDLVSGGTFNLASNTFNAYYLTKFLHLLFYGIVVFSSPIIYYYKSRHDVLLKWLIISTFLLLIISFIVTGIGPFGGRIEGL